MLRQEIKQLLRGAILQAQSEKSLPEFEVPVSPELQSASLSQGGRGEPEILVERTADNKFGDYTTNIALKIAGLVKKNPLEVAEIIARIADDIADEEIIVFDKVEAVKPGFINFYIANQHWQKKVAGILEQGVDFNILNIGQGQKVQVEFISANPTGPLTLGNGRGGFLGDTLANILKKAGYDVSREYYMNNTGFQVEVLGHSILGDEKIQYQGEYIKDLREKFKNSQHENALELGEQAADFIMETMIKPVVSERMKIKFDNFFSEKSLRKSGAVEKIIDLMKRKGLTYENDGALWFKASEFGDDKDRVLITSGQTERGVEGTYLLSDIAYHYDKFIEKKFDKVIDVWAADHHGYVARLQAAKKALDMPGELKIIVTQLVRLFKDGKEFKMSKRAGTYVTIEELLDEISLDAARFFFLMYSINSHMDFNLDLAAEQSQKNPVYYVQYAYARLCSILRKAEENNLKKDKDKILELQPEKCEPELIRKLVQLPEIIEDTAIDYQVQRLPQYALDLVRTFHKYYEECRVISEDKEKTSARIALIEATRIVLKNVLDLMGISAPEKM